MKMYVKGFCGIVMPPEKDNIIEFNQYMKSDKIQYIIYADIESLIRKIDGCTNNPEKSSTTKIGDHILFGYSMLPIWVFYHIEGKYTLYRGKYCDKKICNSLREDAKNIIDFKKKKILLLTQEELRSHQNAKVCYISGKRILKKISKSISY